MAITNFSDFSTVPSCFICRNKHHVCCKNESQYPFISFLFLNLSPKSPKTNSSGCSSSIILEEDEPTYESPVIHRRAPAFDLSSSPRSAHQHFKVEGTETCDRLPDDSKELNAVICGLLNDFRTQELGFECYQKAKLKQGFKPLRYTLKLVIRYLTQSRNWNSLFSFCDDLRVFQVLPGKPTCCKLIFNCIKARKFKLVDMLLDIFLAADVEISVSAFDFAMKGYNQLHMYNSTIVLYQRMRSFEVALDPACYCRIMEAHLKMKHYEKAIEIYQEIENRKLIRFGGVSSPVFTQIYRILCESLGKVGRTFEALEFFREMAKKGVDDNHYIYSSLISSFASAGELNLAEELLEEAESKKMLRDPALFLSLVLRYVEEGLLERTLDVVATMKRVNLRVSDCIFCAIINGFSKKRGLKAAVQVYDDLISKGCDPGQVTYASILGIYCRLGRYSEAETLFTEMENKGFEKCVVSYATMVAAYGKMGRVRDATRLVAKMKERGCEPNVWVYNSLLDMQGKVLNLRAVEKIWKEMSRRKISPDKFSYTAVIDTYNSARELESCVKYYQEFRLNGGKVDRAMAGIMVAVFSKMNRVDDLFELLQDMNMQGCKLDSRFYHSALNALKDAGLQVQAKQLQESFKLSR